jgi:hypothetical protein
MVRQEVRFVLARRFQEIVEVLRYVQSLTVHNNGLLVCRIAPDV